MRTKQGGLMVGVRTMFDRLTIGVDVFVSAQHRLVAVFSRKRGAYGPVQNAPCATAFSWFLARASFQLSSPAWACIGSRGCFSIYFRATFWEGFRLLSRCCRGALPILNCLFRPWRLSYFHDCGGALPMLCRGLLSSACRALCAAIVVLGVTGVPVCSAEPETASRFPGGLVSAFEKTFAGRQPVLWGERLPGVLTRLPEGNGAAPSPRSGSAPAQVLALTLDACGGDYDRGIIALLREMRIPATLFVTGRWIAAHPEVMSDLAADPLFELANHGERHKPASVNGRKAYGIKGTVSVGELVQEVETTAQRIAAFTGHRPRFFRPGTAYCDDVAVDVVVALGQIVAGYTVAADAGATLGADAVSRNLLHAPDRAIILCHMNHPASGTREGLRVALPELVRRNVRFVTLSQGVGASSWPAPMNQP